MRTENIPFGDGDFDPVQFSVLFIGDGLWMSNDDTGKMELVGLENISDMRVFGNHEAITGYSEQVWPYESDG